MIKFFRHIRQRLLSEGKTGKYLKYAIGEINLVVIGILIALQINNWNQDRIERKREISYLKNLKEDVTSNKNQLIKDSIRFKGYLDNTKKGIMLLKTDLNTKNFLKIDSLIGTRWGFNKANRSTYDEMLNNGSFYTIKNKKLREQIANYYLNADRITNSFLEINGNGQDMNYNPDIFPINLLVSHLEENPINLIGIDTTWMSNKNSKTYVGYFRRAKYFEVANSVRIELMKQFENNSDTLLIVINKELKHHD